MTAKRPTGSLDASAWLAQRHPKPKRHSAKVWLIGALVVVVCLAGGWLVAFSPVFAVRSVTVTGLTTLTADEVTAAAAVPPGRPVVRLDKAGIVARVEAIPTVAHADVVASLNGHVDIRVTERTPVCAVAGAGTYDLVDASGTAYLTVPELPAGVPVANLSGTDTARLTTDAATIASALPAAVLAKVTSITASSPDSFSLALAGGATVFWGSAEQSGLKAQVVSALLVTPASYYDVSSPSHPATR